MIKSQSSFKRTELISTSSPLDNSKSKISSYANLKSAIHSEIPKHGV